MVASDHGNEFWDHAELGGNVHVDPRRVAGFSHGHSLFGELLDVPLIMSGPGIRRGRVPGMVRNIDIAPTILTLAGVAVPASMRGVDLVRATAVDPFPTLVAARGKAQRATSSG